MTFSSSQDPTRALSLNKFLKPITFLFPIIAAIDPLLGISDKLWIFLFSDFPFPSRCQCHLTHRFLDVCPVSVTRWSPLLTQTLSLLPAIALSREGMFSFCRGLSQLLINTGHPSLPKERFCSYFHFWVYLLSCNSMESYNI